MAFTATEKATLAEIVGITPSALATHLDYVVLSAEVEDAVQADIALWADYRNANDVSVEPMESNLGARIEGGGVRNAITRRIANWLELDLAVAGGSWVRTERS